MDASRRFARVMLLALAGTSLLAASCGDKPTTPTPPTTYTLTVRVQNDQSQAVPNAAVRVLDGANAGKSATTDATGAATLSNLSAGGFSIEVSAAGYLTATSGVTLTAAQTVNVQLNAAANAPPVISAITAQGTRPNEPANYADPGEEIVVSATVTDAETAGDKLTYEWSAPTGTFSGSGPSVRWRAPGGISTPATVTLTLTVVEAYLAGRENRVSATRAVDVHDSAKESGDIATQFLSDFSNSSVPADTVINRSFSTSSRCADGRSSELGDVADNRVKFRITSYQLGPATSTVNFGSFCSFRNRPGDACVSMSCRWVSAILDKSNQYYPGPETSSGTCYLSTVFDDTRSWRVCWSDWNGSSTHPIQWMR